MYTYVSNEHIELDVTLNRDLGLTYQSEQLHEPSYCPT